MNYTTDIKPLEDAGLSDDDIASVLSSLTARPVPFGEFVNFLDDEGLANRHPISLKWEGTLPEIAVTDGHPLQAGIAKLFSHLNKPQSVQVDTTQTPWCIMAAQLLAGLVQMQVITEGHRSGFYALGGGLRHGVVTVEQIEGARTQYAFSSRVTNATALFSERMQSGDDPAAVMAQAWEDAA